MLKREKKWQHGHVGRLHPSLFRGAISWWKPGYESTLLGCFRRATGCSARAVVGVTLKIAISSHSDPQQQPGVYMQTRRTTPGDDLYFTF